MIGMHGGREGPILLADIGGTNARFAVLRGGQIAARNVMKVDSHAGPQSAIVSFLDTLESAPQMVAAVLAVAGPVEGRRARLTNAAWDFDAVLLESALGFPVNIVNDFEAQAWATGGLDANELSQIGGDRRLQGAPAAVIGPGTGLGVAGYLPGVDGRPGRAIVGEGGHMTLSPRNDAQSEILAKCRARFGHVSAERLLCGSGLVLLSSLLAGNGDPSFESSRALVAAAQKGNPLARHTLAVFFDFLGTAAGNIALTFGARGGVFLTGGILPALEEELATSGFRQAFEAKGRMRDYLISIPCFLVRAEDPAFIGLRVIAANLWN